MVGALGQRIGRGLRRVRPVGRWLTYQGESCTMYSVTTNPDDMAVLDGIMAYEQGDLDDGDIIELFAKLIRTGMAWRLQGSYGRMAVSLIEEGYISPAGEVL